MKKDDLPVNKECHCMANAKRYRVKGFINQLNHHVFRCFYRCENCYSRIHEDFIDFSGFKTIDIMDFRSEENIKKYNHYL